MEFTLMADHPVEKTKTNPIFLRPKISQKIEKIKEEHRDQRIKISEEPIGLEPIIYYQEFIQLWNKARAACQDDFIHERFYTTDKPSKSLYNFVEGADSRLIYQAFRADNMTQNCISDLKLGAKNKVLEAKVYRKWINRNLPKTTPTDYCCILIDREVDLELYIQHLKSLYYTDPKAIFFHSAAQSKQIWAPMIFPTLVNYIGCLTRVGNIRDVGNPNTSQSKIRRLDVENLNGDVVEVTLWDEMEIDFSREEFKNMEQPVIFAVSSYKANIYGGIQLSGTPVTHYYFNPDIPDLEELRNQQKQISNQHATIAESRWIQGGNGEAYCVNHEPQKTATCLYNFKEDIMDQLVTALVTFFTPNANVLTGKSCTQLVKKYGTPDPREFPKEILSLNGQTHIFQIHYNPSCVKGRVDFYFDDILDKPLRIVGPSGIQARPTVTPLPTTPGTDPQPIASIGAGPCTTEGQPSDTQDPVGETTTKTTKRGLFPEESA
ncbi:nucleic acid-binding, OB-fold protein [Tanacetum coccineum]